MKIARIIAGMSGEDWIYIIVTSGWVVTWFIDPPLALGLAVPVIFITLGMGLIKWRERGE